MGPREFFRQLFNGNSKKLKVADLDMHDQLKFQQLEIRKKDILKEREALIQKNDLIDFSTRELWIEMEKKHNLIGKILSYKDGAIYEKIQEEILSED